VPVEFLVELVDFLADRASVSDGCPPKLEAAGFVRMSLKGHFDPFPPTPAGAGGNGKDARLRKPAKSVGF
jgi:hypothetical protein